MKAASGSPRGASARPTSPKAGAGAKAGAGGQDEQAQKLELQQAQKKIRELEKRAMDSEKTHKEQDVKRKKDFEMAKKKLSKDVKEKESEMKKVDKQIQKLTQSISKIDKTQEAAKKKLKETSQKIQEQLDKAELDKRNMQRQLIESQGQHSDCCATLALLKKAQAKLAEGIIMDTHSLDGQAGSSADGVPLTPGPAPSSLGDSMPGSPVEPTPSGPAEQAPGSSSQELEDGVGGDDARSQKVSFLPDDDEEDEDDDVDELPEWRATRALRQSVRELEALDRGLSDAADEAARPPPSPTPPDGGRAGALAGATDGPDADTTSQLRAATAEATVAQLRQRLAESERARQALEAGARPDPEAADLRRRLLELEAACAQSPGTQAQRSQQAAIRLRAVLDTVAAPEAQRQALAGLCGQLLQPVAGDAPPPHAQGLLEEAEREARSLQEEAAAELRDLRSRCLRLQEEARAAQPRQGAETEELRAAYSQCTADMEELKVELEATRVARTQALAEVPVLQAQAEVAEFEAQRLRGELLKCRGEVAELRGQLALARGPDLQRAGLTSPTSLHLGQPRAPLAPDELTRSLRQSPLSTLGPGAAWPSSPHAADSPPLAATAPRRAREFGSPPYPEMRTLVAEAEAAAEGLRDTLRQRSEEVERVKAQLLRRGQKASELQAGLNGCGDAGPLGRLVALADSERAILEATQEQGRTEPVAVPARPGPWSPEARRTPGADRAFPDFRALLASPARTPPPPAGSPAHAAGAWSEQVTGVASLPWSPASPPSAPSA